jgi:hypothetical protein
MNSSSVLDCALIQLPKINLEAGSITAINELRELPFPIKRIYFLYDVPSGVDRGGHAHKELQQLIIAVSGSFDLIVDDGKKKLTFNLNRPSVGVLMPSGLWRELLNFSSGSICLVLASHEYDENDYVREYEQFKRMKYDS